MKSALFLSACAVISVTASSEQATHSDTRRGFNMEKGHQHGKGVRMLPAHAIIDMHQMSTKRPQTLTSRLFT